MNSLENTTPASIPGYEYGTPSSAISPVSESDLSELEQTAGWTSADAGVLARHADLFRAEAESMVDSWRAVIGAQPHLAHWFVKPDGTPDDAYKESVKRRFVQWVVDVALRPHDRDWLNYQQEIGLRHIPAKKNKTDGAHTPPVVPLRYLLGFVPMVLPIRLFLAEAMKDEAELKRLGRRLDQGRDSSHHALVETVPERRSLVTHTNWLVTRSRPMGSNGCFRRHPLLQPKSRLFSKFIPGSVSDNPVFWRQRFDLAKLLSEKSRH